MNRNVLCTSNPYESNCTPKLTNGRRSQHLLPRTRAYAEIWLDQEKGDHDEEPILGQTYLPRKFKTTVVIPPQNDIDLHANDMNFAARKTANWWALTCWWAVVCHEHGINKNLCSHGERVGYSPVEHTLAVAEALSPPSATGVTVPTVKTRRPNIRWSVGVETFKAEVERLQVSNWNRSVRNLPARRSHWLGEGIDNKWHLTLFIENGRFSIIGASAENGPLEIAKIHEEARRITANRTDHRSGARIAQKAKIEKSRGSAA
jgi:sulfite reductase (NADPH) hemoprotein beta-component